jgi:hypothetical protein
MVKGGRHVNFKSVTLRFPQMPRFQCRAAAVAPK